MEEEIRRIRELTEENNQMLKKMRRSQQIASVMRALYWLVIIGSAIGAYYLFQPYIDQLKNVYGGASDVLQNFKQINQ
ncbi:hypothetical protein A2933_01395 [Candidatus Nomurabacteria bacterium RIFCSPLOWO2_01_FULL_46_18]|uniref:Uncharacterized protein n=1 Tax=Candidatus Nomurabacteria bacterium RIFCSPLOWO2_01_FULL_46_18 TaxID=1801783 RepID=A0A1F6XBE3_9BACT|nr:MAG: hypothetical protein A2933_01395 [Candidatus Nomurabacteria bacterium RIFCSPLOWO2_01_FULL_46_18]